MISLVSNNVVSNVTIIVYKHRACFLVSISIGFTTYELLIWLLAKQYNYYLC